MFVPVFEDDVDVFASADELELLLCEDDEVARLAELLFASSALEEFLTVSADEESLVSLSSADEDELMLSLEPLSLLELLSTELNTLELAFELLKSELLTTELAVFPSEVLVTVLTATLVAPNASTVDIIANGVIKGAVRYAI